MRWKIGIKLSLRLLLSLKSLLLFHFKFIRQLLLYIFKKWLQIEKHVYIRTLRHYILLQYMIFGMWLNLDEKTQRMSIQHLLCVGIPSYNCFRSILSKEILPFVKKKITLILRSSRLVEASSLVTKYLCRSPSFHWFLWKHQVFSFL